MNDIEAHTSISRVDKPKDGYSSETNKVNAKNKRIIKEIIIDFKTGSLFVTFLPLLEGITKKKTPCIVLPRGEYYPYIRAEPSKYFIRVVVHLNLDNRQIYGRRKYCICIIRK